MQLARPRLRRVQVREVVCAAGVALHLDSVRAGRQDAVGEVVLSEELPRPVPRRGVHLPSAGVVELLVREPLDVCLDPRLERGQRCQAPLGLRTLEAALWAFATTGDFESGALAAVNLGGDADTTGAVYGQLAGAFYGARHIPQSWSTRVAMGMEITRVAERLHAFAERYASRVMPLDPEVPRRWQPADDGPMYEEQIEWRPTQDEMGGEQR